MLLLVTVGTATVIAAACGLGTNGTGENVVDRPEGSTPVDATVGDEGFVVTDSGTTQDSGVADSATDGGAADGEAGTTFDCDDAGLTSCATCAGRPTACAANHTCVAECSTDCPGARVACFRCFGGGVVVEGTCEVENDAGYCMGGVYAPGAACPCFNRDASTCPGDFQMCLDAGSGYACHSCGEPFTDKVVCKGGSGAQKCDLGGNATDHLTCH